MVDKVILVKTGIYRHYKGAYYEVLGTARHTESEEEMVVYRALYGEFGLWVRPLGMFLEDVEVEGDRRSRFEFISEEKGEEFLKNQDV